MILGLILGLLFSPKQTQKARKVTLTRLSHHTHKRRIQPEFLFVSLFDPGWLGVALEGADA